MPSMEAVWDGQCANQHVQQDLCGSIGRLANLSNELHQKYFKEKIDSIIHSGAKVYEKILLDGGSLFHKQMVPISIKLFEKEIYLTEKITLFGIGFSFYDPRNYTPPFALRTSNKMSFIFLRSEDPALDGRLVAPFSLNPKHPLHGSGELYLTSPTLDMRYYMESWTGMLLRWVKYFYIPNLYFWPFDNNQRADEYLKFSTSDRETAEAQFNLLLDQFSEEAMKWSAEHDLYLNKMGLSRK